MAPDQRRFTAAEWRDIQHEYRESPRRGVRSMYPSEEIECDLGPFIPVPAPFKPHPHLEAWFVSLSKDDVTRLETLIALRPETIAWVSGKSPTELKSLDGAVEFVTSSRTAAKVIAWCFVTAATAFGLVVTAAKNGMDLFQIFRGGK